MKAYWKAFGLLHVVVAVPWMGPMETLIGLWPLDGISPRPTQAPGLNGLPRELVKREGDLTLPANYCGFVSGDPQSPLTCGTSQTCVSDGFAAGCCEDPDFCTNLYTSCVNHVDILSDCDASCISDYSILKCSYTDIPYCAAWSFYDGNALFDCKEIAISTVIPVEDIGHFNSTATVLPALTTFSTNPPDPIPSSTDKSTAFSTQSSPTIIPVPSSHHGVAAGVIGGVIAGAGVVAIACGLLVFLCIRRRNTRRAAEIQAAQPRPSAQFDQTPPPMQQQSMGLLGQQSVQPQHQSQASYLNPQTPGSTYATTVSHGPPSPVQSNFPSHDLNHRTSTVTSNPFSPVPSTTGGSENHTYANSDAGYFQPPHPSPSPPPILGAESKMSNLDSKTMQNMHDPQRQQSPPPQVSEVHGTMVSFGMPIQDNKTQSQTYTTQGMPFQDSQTHSYSYTTTSSYSEGQRHEMPGVLQPGSPPRVGPWELGGGRG